MHRIVARGRVGSQAVQRVRAAMPEVQIDFDPAEQPAPNLLAEADVLAGDFTTAELRGATNLRWVHLWSAGVDGRLLPGDLTGRVQLTASKGNGAIPLAEHALMLMLMLSRSMPRLIEAQHARVWRREMHPELTGKTVGIVGLGRAGREVATRCRAFGMRVLGLRRRPAEVEEVDRVLTGDRVEMLCSESDFVVVTAPHTPETTGLLSSRAFAVMKPSAYYICLSRGGIADDDALLTALREGWIAGAGLDAHATEPLPSNSPFWSLPNIIITPHCGALTPESEQRRVDDFLTNLRRYVEGRPLMNLIDHALGY